MQSTLSPLKTYSKGHWPILLVDNNGAVNRHKLWDDRMTDSMKRSLLEFYCRMWMKLTGWDYLGFQITWIRKRIPLFFTTESWIKCWCAHEGCNDWSLLKTHKTGIKDCMLSRANLCVSEQRQWVALSKEAY